MPKKLQMSELFWKFPSFLFTFSRPPISQISIIFYLALDFSLVVPLSLPDYLFSDLFSLLFSPSLINLSLFCKRIVIVIYELVTVTFFYVNFNFFWLPFYLLFHSLSSFYSTGFLFMCVIFD